MDSMLSNAPITVKTLIPTTAGTGDTFTIFETGYVTSGSSIVIKNKLQLERMVVDIATDGTCTIVLRGLDNSETKTEVSGNKKERGTGSTGYITVLASDLLDVDNTGGAKELKSDLILSGDNTHSGTNTFSGDVETTKSFKEPVYADATARDAGIPTPSDGMRIYNTAVGLFQKYQGGAWVNDDSGGSVPNASETVAGKVEIATDTEVDNGTDTGGTGAGLVVKPSQLKSAKDNISAITDNTYYPGETANKGEFMFVEDEIKVTDAITEQNIGDVAANTRVSRPVFGSGTADSTINLALAVQGSPSVDLGIRIETDDNGSPSGTLVDANATATISATSLTTNLADTTITLVGSITLTEGQKYHLVVYQGTYGSETVNASNYYGIGYKKMNTTTRNALARDGTTWDESHSSGINVVDTSTGASYSGLASDGKIIFTPKYNLFLKSVVASGNDGYVLTGGGYNQSESTGIFNVFLKKGIEYTISLGGGYPCYYNDTKTSNNVVFGTGVQLPLAVTLNTELAFIVVDFFIYADSNLFLPNLLSKTNATYSYKTDRLGSPKEDVVIGTKPSLVIDGVDSNQIGMTYGDTMYLSDTPGAISSTPGTNSTIVGRAISATKLMLKNTFNR